MSAKVNYINLTSGLEWADKLHDFKVVKLSSTHFEGNAMWTAIMGLDYGFLIDAALHGVVLHDCGSRNGPVSRAQWKGVPWLLWAYRRTAGIVDDVHINSGCKGECKVTGEFDQFYQFGEPIAGKKAKQKLRYIRKLTGAGRLSIECRSMPSTMDGQTERLGEFLTPARLSEAA